ncbi:MAG: hypothetical protein LRZ84_10515 [Desertifilum sp.]|nr:hypothetical protein [Desertifilum sp.]
MKPLTERLTDLYSELEDLIGNPNLPQSVIEALQQLLWAIEENYPDEF